MTKIDIFSGFLGAGKTTLIKKLISEAYKGEKIVIIENEFGQIGIDGGFLKEAGVEISEINSGCICCSLVGDFGAALEKVIAEFSPDRIIIEPSGVGKLSDVIKATEKVVTDEVVLNSFTTVIDATKCKIYLKNFAEFYENQIVYANTIILSRTQSVNKDKLDEAIKLIKDHNSEAAVITTPWEQLDGMQIVGAMEKKNTLSAVMDELEHEMHEHHHHHHDDEDEHDHHEHHHDDDCDCECCAHDHEHEHHHHDEYEHHHHDEHQHHHDEDCDCECCAHDHEHEHHEHHHDEHEHHHHHADEVFESWGVETADVFSVESIKNALEKLNDSTKYGTILRAKGFVASEGEWIHFDFVPGDSDVRFGPSDVTGRICVIGSKINKAEIAELFGIK